MSSDEKDHVSDGQGAAATTAPTGASRSRRIIIVAVIAVFVVLALAKAMSAGTIPSTTPDAEQTGTGLPAAGTTITSVHNDAVADFDAAIASGKPIYVLFHSLSCQPCVEISAVADSVIPEYEDDVVFVNAITDDPSGQQLASRFSFQYIPTSFFIAPGGEEVVDSFTGAMDAEKMRGYLDALVSAE